MPAQDEAPPTLTRDDVIKVAMLARLALSDTELSSLTEELSKIVGFVSQLSELDTDEVEPLAHPLDSKMYFERTVPSPHSQLLTPSVVHHAMMRNVFLFQRFLVSRGPHRAK